MQPDLYPNGIKNAQATLDLLREEFQKTRTRLIEIEETFSQKQSLLEAKHLEIIQQVEIILADAPPVPRLIRILPPFLRQWALPFYYYRKYARQIHELRNLKQKLTHLLWKRVGLSIQEQILKQILESLQNWNELLEQATAEYERFLDQFMQAGEMFQKDWGMFPLGDEENGWHEIFRVPAVHQPFAEWCYKNWFPGLDDWVVDLFETSAFRDHWREIEAEVIASRLLSISQQAYQALWNLSLDDVLSHESVTQPFDLVSNPLAETMQTSLPLLRPDFDAIGSARISYTSAYGLLAVPEWEFCKLPSLPGTTIKWEPFYTHDPYIALCVQTRHTVPLSSLTALSQLGMEKFKQLPPEIQRKYAIVSAVDALPITSISGHSDPDNPDKIVKIFR